MARTGAASPEWRRRSPATGRRRLQWEHLGGYEAESLARRLLDGLGLGHVDLGQRFANLSGGQKTRLALAALLFRRPELLVLDEPTNHLDRTSAGWLMDFLVGLSGTVLLVSHDLACLTAPSTACSGRRAHGRDRGLSRQLQRLSIPARGEARPGGKAGAPRGAADVAVAGDGRPLARPAPARPRPSRSRSASSVCATRCRSRCSPPRARNCKTLATAATGRLVLAVEDLWKAYADNIVLMGVGFTLERGQKLALLGPQRRRQDNAAQDHRRQGRDGRGQGGAGPQRAHRLLRPGARGAQSSGKRAWTRHGCQRRWRGRPAR